MLGMIDNAAQVPANMARIMQENTSVERRLHRNQNEASYSMRSIRELEDVALSLCQCEHEKGGRRIGMERRQFSYSLYIPEKRSGQERRKNQDRRNGNKGR